MLFSPSLTVWAQRRLSLNLFPSLFPPPLTVWAQRTLSLDLFPWLFPLLLALWAQRRISLNLFPIISRLNVVQSQEICCLCPKSFLGPEKLGYTHLISICCTQKFRKPWGINSRNLLLCLIAILLAYADMKKGLAAPAQDQFPALGAPSPFNMLDSPPQQKSRCQNHNRSGQIEHNCARSAGCGKLQSHGVANGNRIDSFCIGF